MNKYFDLIGEEHLSEDARWHILDNLYDARSAFVATIVQLMAAGYGWNRGLHDWAAIWAVGAIVILIFRLTMFHVYRKRSRQGPLAAWKACLTISGLVTGLLWGIGGVAFVKTGDGEILCTVFAVLTGLQAGVGARNCCFPIAAIIQVVTTGIVIAICTSLAGFWIIVVLTAMFVGYNVVSINSLAALNLKNILSDQERKGLLVSLARQNAEIETANARLQEISLTDALTNVANRRCFDGELAVFWAQAARRQTSIALLFIDVDHFKRFNDTYGHLAGDACLTLVAAAIKSAVRSEADRLSRYGGEEFAILLLDTDATEAADVAERVGKAVRSVTVPVGNGRSTVVTVSIGVAAVVPDPDIPPAMLISLADQGVYRAKKNGRNCVRLGEAHGIEPSADIEAPPLAPAIPADIVSLHEMLPGAA